MALRRSTYGFGTRIPLAFDEAVRRTTELLQAENYGVLTTVDVQRTMKEKLDVEFRRYVILGVCNPRLAQRAYAAELEIGLLLPCNVIVYQDDADVVVSFMDPGAVMELVGNPALASVAAEARTRLIHVAEKLDALNA
jgi:uncharacterized protein (DUF302 family)